MDISLSYKDKLREKLVEAYDKGHLTIADSFVIYFWSMFNRIRYYAFIYKILDDRKGFFAYKYAKTRNKAILKQYVEMIYVNLGRVKVVHKIVYKENIVVMGFVKIMKMNYLVQMIVKKL